MRNIYLQQIKDQLNQVETDGEIFEKAASVIVSAIETGKTIFTFGASHAGILSEELFYRAGGLVLFNPIFDRNLMLDTRPVTKTSELETFEGYGSILANSVPFQDGDVLIAHSVSGRNPVMIDLVLAAKKRGVKIIAITNMTYSSETQSRHSSGKRLFELADVTFDNYGKKGDASVYIEELEQYIAPTSTVIGATIVNMLLVEVVKTLLEKNIDPPIFYSANLDETKEKNNEILNANSARIHYM